MNNSPSFDFNWEKFSVLIVEDNQSNFFLLEQYLKYTKINIHHVKDGSDAINFMKNEPKVDLILMDIKLPIVDGLTASKAIKINCLDIPIIAQTAYYKENEHSILHNSGIDELISKPIEREKLFAVLSKYLH